MYFAFSSLDVCVCVSLVISVGCVFVRCFVMWFTVVFVPPVWRFCCYYGLRFQSLGLYVIVSLVSSFVVSCCVFVFFRIVCVYVGI